MKRSKIWLISKSELEDLIKNSSSMSAVLRALGLRDTGGNTYTLKDRILIENIVCDLKSKESTRKYTTEEILVKDTKYLNKTEIKNRILREQLIPYLCSSCGIGPEWNQEKLVLQIEHINGNNRDYRLENLTFLCPNCHSQTVTFTGKRLKKERGHCSVCTKGLSKKNTSGLCSKHYQGRMAESG